MGGPLNGNATEERLGQVIAYRNLAARLKESYHEEPLSERPNLGVAVAVWFQAFLATEADEFWQGCYRHLEGVVQAETLRVWMGYPEHWELPAALRHAGVDASRVVFADGWGLYPVEKPRGAHRAGTFLPDGLLAEEAFVSPHGTYLKGAIVRPGSGPAEPLCTLQTWHRAYKRPVPSRTAIHRCLRMCVLSRLVGRRLESSKELLTADGQAFLQWALVQSGKTALSEGACSVMRALLLDDEFVVLVHQLPRRSGL